MMGTGRGREGVYKLEAAALAGLGDVTLALRLYGEACQPMACVHGVYPLHPSLAPHVSAPFPPRSLIAPEKWQVQTRNCVLNTMNFVSKSMNFVLNTRNSAIKSEPWTGDFARAYTNALPCDFLLCQCMYQHLLINIDSILVESCRPTLMSGLAQGLAQGNTFWKFQEKAHEHDGQFVSYWHGFKGEYTSDPHRDSMQGEGRGGVC